MPQVPITDIDGNPGATYLSATVSPASQNLTWDRTQALPTVTPLHLVSNADFVDVSINFENTATEWLSVNGQGSAVGLDFNSSADVSLEIINAAQLNGSNYKAVINIDFTTSNGGYRSISRTISLNITGNSATALQTNKPKYEVSYNRETGQISGETAISILNNSANDNLEIEFVGSVFKPETGTGNFTIENNPQKPLATNPDLPASGITEVFGRLKKNGQNIFYFTVNLTIAQSEHISTTAQSLDFALRKGQNETQTKSFTLINPANKNYTVTAPSWLTANPASGNSGGVLEFKTVNSENIAVGNYTGNIILKAGTDVVTVPVSLSVTAFLNFTSQNYNFCKDGFPVTISRMNSTAIFVRLKMTVEIQGETVEFSYQLPYFRGKATTDIGEKIHNFYKNFEENLLNEAVFFNEKIYKFSKVSVVVEELDASYTVLFLQNISDLKFFPGKKPALFPLFSNHKTRRFHDTADTFIYSFLADNVSAGNFAQNQNFANTVNSGEVHASRFSVPGIEAQKVSKNFGLNLLPIPKSKRGIYLMQWQNQNLVPESFTFSGPAKINYDFENLAETYEFGGKKYDASELMKITLNTGFILREEIALIREMLKSRLCFLDFEGEICRCFFTTTKIEEDLEATVLEHSLEVFIVKNK